MRTSGPRSSAAARSVSIGTPSGLPSTTSPTSRPASRRATAECSRWPSARRPRRPACGRRRRGLPRCRCVCPRPTRRAIVPVRSVTAAGARSPPNPYTRCDAERAGQRAARPHRAQAGDRARRLPAGAPARRVRVRARAARPPLPERAHDPHLLRALLPHGAHAPGHLDGALDRGRPRLLDDRRPGGPAAAVAAGLCPARPGAGRPARHRPLGRAQLPRLPPPHPALRRARRPLRRAARPGPRRLRHVPVRAGPGGRAERDRDRPGRRVRRLVRLVRGAGVRDPLSAPAAIARPRRHLPAAGLRPRPRRHRPEHAQLAPAGVRAPARLPGRRPAAAADRAAHPACAQPPDQRDRARRGRDAHPRHRRHEHARAAGPVGLLLPGRVARHLRRDTVGVRGRRRPAAAARGRDGHHRRAERRSRASSPSRSTFR